MNFQFSIFNFQSRKGGFTLVEMIVSLMIFSIVAVVALAALVKIIDANNKAQTIQSAVTSLSFSLDSMSRELRSGSEIYCIASDSFNPGDMVNPLGCSSYNQSQSNVILAFQSQTLDNTQPNGHAPCHLIYAYRFESASANGPVSLLKAEQQKYSSDNNNTDCKRQFSDSDFTSVIPSNVTLTSYQLGVSYDQTTQPFPLVFVELSGSAGNKETTKTYFTVQTAASPRTP
jgi:prepilin-type N-terminal cleavage/methylation domain-containing protein